VIKYEVVLKSTEIPASVEADMFLCEPGSVVFYIRPTVKGEEAQEVRRFPASNVKAIKE